ncbi:MAG: hypothetical protein EOP00_12130 [Pedobacter sp.]|nr:MAG: hypothetical protein EOP00_12130 [Pedobacter sp.]
MNKRYAASLEYAEKLKAEMEKFDSAFYKRYEFFYYNALVINFSVINPLKAINILVELSQKEKIDKLTFNGVFVYLNLVVLYYGQKDYSKALQSMVKLYNYKDYQTTDERLKLKINLGELMMRYEKKEFDVLNYRLKQVYKDFDTFLKANADIWEAGFLDVFGKILQTDKQRNSTGIKETAHKLISNIKNNTTQDDMLFAYDNWIAEKAKIDM